MSNKKYPSPDMVKPHRCAFLMDNLFDAMHPWNTSELRIAYHAFRDCLKNEEINADLSQKPKYLTLKPEYEDMFDSEKLKEKADQARAQEKIRRESFKKGETKDKE